MEDSVNHPISLVSRGEYGPILLRIHIGWHEHNRLPQIGDLARSFWLGVRSVLLPITIKESLSFLLRFRETQYCLLQK
jgi:hypothetical protein